MNEDKVFRIIISSANDVNNAVPAIILADYIRSIQNIVYVTCDFICKNTYRSGGDFPKKVKDNCKLLFNDLKLGSIDTTIFIQSQSQTTLPELNSIGTQTYDLTKEIINIVNSETAINEKLFEIIPDEFRINRILKEIDSIWPDESSEYSIKMYCGEENCINLSPQRKEIIQNAKNVDPVKYSAEIYGRIVDVRVDKKQKFELNTTIGDVEGHYSTKHEQAFRSMLGSFVKISGIIEVKGGKKRIKLNPESDSIKEIKFIPLNIITTEQNEQFELSRTLNIDLEWDVKEKEYILTNKEFNLLGISNNIKEALNEIEQGIIFLRDEYLLEDNANLTKKAIELKNSINNLFGGK